EGLIAYTWALPAGDDWFVADEREFVDAYLAEHPLDHHYIIPDSGQIFADRPELRHLHDGPNWDLFHYSINPTFAHAAERGIRALIFGNGGDEIASYPAADYLVALALQLRPQALVHEVRAHAQNRGLRVASVWRGRVARPLLDAVLGKRAFAFEHA